MASSGFMSRCSQPSVSSLRLLAAGTCLQQLDLSDNPMTSEVADALAQMLRSQAHLRILNLNDTSLEDEGVITIAGALVDAGALPFTSMIQVTRHFTWSLQSAEYAANMLFCSPPSLVCKQRCFCSLGTAA